MTTMFLILISILLSSIFGEIVAYGGNNNVKQSFFDFGLNFRRIPDGGFNNPNYGSYRRVFPVSQVGGYYNNIGLGGGESGVRHEEFRPNSNLQNVPPMVVLMNGQGRLADIGNFYRNTPARICPVYDVIGQNQGVSDVSGSNPIAYDVSGRSASVDSVSNVYGANCCVNAVTQSSLHNGNVATISDLGGNYGQSDIASGGGVSNFGANDGSRIESSSNPSGASQSWRYLFPQSNTGTDVGSDTNQIGGSYNIGNVNNVGAYDNPNTPFADFGMPTEGIGNGESVTEQTEGVTSVTEGNPSVTEGIASATEGSTGATEGVTSLTRGSTSTNGMSTFETATSV